MAQFGRPDSDTVQDFFTGGFSVIDEATASDADFAYGANNTVATLEVGLTSLTDPGVDTGHIIRFRAARVDDGVVDGGGSGVTVTVHLYQGASPISSNVAAIATTGSWQQTQATVPTAAVATITDYSDLRLRFTTTASGGSPANRRGGAVSWAELEVPDAGGPSAIPMMVSWIQDDIG